MTEQPKRRGRPPGPERVRVFWTMPPDVAETVAERAASERTTESYLVEGILRGSRRLRRPVSSPVQTEPEEGSQDA